MNRYKAVLFLGLFLGLGVSLLTPRDWSQWGSAPSYAVWFTIPAFAIMKVIQFAIWIVFRKLVLVNEQDFVTLWRLAITVVVAFYSFVFFTVAQLFRKRGDDVLTTSASEQLAAADQSSRTR